MAYLLVDFQSKGVESYLVGGGVVELYAAGQFVSGNVDIKITTSSAERQLQEMGFNREGMILLSKDLGIAVQIVGRYPSRTEKVRSIEVDGRIVKIVGAEDL